MIRQLKTIYYINGQQTYEKMFIINNNQRNTEENKMTFPPG